VRSPHGRTCDKRNIFACDNVAAFRFANKLLQLSAQIRGFLLEWTGRR